MIDTFINKVCEKIQDKRYYYSMDRENSFSVDCSSLLLNSLKECGIDTQGATYTGNMSNLTKNGNFTKIAIAPGVAFQRGDILVKHISGSNGHTVLYLGNNQIAEACNKKYGLRICQYYANGYQYILRYTGKALNTTLPPTIKRGCKNIYVGFIQLFLNVYEVNRLKIDSDLGPKTEDAIKNFQLKYNLEVDGICGVQTWTKIMLIMTGQK